MVYEIFIVGGVLFWVLAAVVGLILSAFVINERGSAASALLAGFFVVLACFGNFNIFTYAWHNPIDFLTYIAAYFSVGILWSVAKWHFFTRDKREQYEDLKATFLHNNNISGNVIPDAMKATWAEYCKGTMDTQYYSSKADAASIIPRAKKHKARISRWIGYWPISLFWTICDDFIKSLCRWLSSAIMNLLQSISNRNFKGIESDFVTSNQSKPNP